MGRVRRNRRIAAAVSVLAALLVVALLWGAGRGSGRPSDGTLGTPPLATPTATPQSLLTGPPTPSAVTPSAQPDGTLAGLAGEPGGPVTAGSSYQGLKGHSYSESIPKHHVVLSLRSAHKLPFVIYNVPTSRDHRAGRSTDLGDVWTLATTAYGKPDYAQLFTRAGPEGYPITCTITVDGRVTARLTTDGPWGKIFCQG